MSIDWSTFVLEIVNFLVLVWILQRFLYRPVLAVIERRRAGIEKTLAEAKAREDAARELELRYQGRVDAWEKERETARHALAQELEAERSRRLRELGAALAAEREKAGAAEVMRLSEARQKIERAAADNGARFAARLLRDVAGPDMESRLVDRAVAALAALPEERVAALRGGWGTAADSLSVTTAYPLDEPRRKLVETALTRLAGTAVPVRLAQDPDLIAGIRVVFGAWTLGANIRDELDGFAELADVL
jgi:F-type H+-transporting ATPase subunit b